MRNLDKDGNIAEPTSTRWGHPPDSDEGREKTLLRWGWLWLLIPIAGIAGYSIVRDELTNRWGHYPWWM